MDLLLLYAKMMTLKNCARAQLGALLLVALLAFDSQIVKCSLVELLESDRAEPGTAESGANDKSAGGFISRSWQQQKLDFQRIAKDANKLRNPSTLKAKLGGLINNAVAPVKNCVSLVNRYHAWFQNYKTLQRDSPVPMKDSMEVLKEEYTKVDEEMRAEAAPNEVPDAEAPASGKSEDPNSMGHIFKVLQVVIDRLEAKLAEQVAKQGLTRSDESGVAKAEVHEHVDEERVKQAMDRIKSALMGAGKALVIGEGANIARTAVFHALAQYYAAKPDTGDALDQLRPIVALLGSAATPVAVSYLMGIQFRVALAAFSAMNPLSLFDKDPKEQMSINDDRSLELNYSD